MKRPWPTGGLMRQKQTNKQKKKEKKNLLFKYWSAAVAELRICESLSCAIKLCSSNNMWRIKRTQTGITTGTVKPTFPYAVKAFTGNSDRTGTSRFDTRYHKHFIRRIKGGGVHMFGLTLHNVGSTTSNQTESVSHDSSVPRRFIMFLHSTACNLHGALSTCCLQVDTKSTHPDHVSHQALREPNSVCNDGVVHIQQE
jgi:hypothetical protein